MSTFDETGLVVDRKPEIVAKLADRIHDVWGEDHRTDPQSVTGQIIEIFAEMFADQNELALSISSGFRPDDAFGVWLSELVKMNGIERKESARSIVALDVTANSAGAQILKGDLVSSEAGIGPFAIDADVSLGSNETKTVSATCTTVGAVDAPADTLQKILTPRLGWASVNNNSAAVIGQNEERDDQLRERRRRTAAAVGTNSTSRLWDRLTNLENVEQVRIIEHETPDVGSLVPERHIWCIVYGGSDETIAQTIFEVGGAGVETHGSTSFVVSDTVRNLQKTINFERPVDYGVKVEITTRKLPGYSLADDALIKQAITDYINSGKILIGGLVVRGDLYAPAYSIPNHQVQSIRLGQVGFGWVVGDLILDPNERAVGAVSAVTIVSAP